MRTQFRKSIKLTLWLTLSVSAFLLVSSVMAQDKPSAAEVVENLKMQMLDLDARESELKLRLEQINEEMKPENIARSFAGVGSTHPEELREQRRRQLQIEKDSLTVQLQQLEARKSKLQTSLLNAETQAYHESANGFPGVENKMSGSAIPLRWLPVIGFLGLAAIVVTLFAFRRLGVGKG